MNIREVQAKSILSKSQIYPHVINAYTGCQHGCAYCYAHFMKRFTGHREPWGQFVDVKVNAAALLEKEIERKAPARVWLSGVCDPYQPLEGRYRLTRRCLEILLRHGWPVVIQTRSPLVLRDLDLLRGAPGVEVGFSLPTADDAVRRIFEPSAPPVAARLSALDELHRSGVRTFAMIAPMLPGAEELAGALAGKVHTVIADRMNYHYADKVYHAHGLERYLSDEFFEATSQRLYHDFARLGVTWQHP